jgi:hypothetical protein
VTAFGKNKMANRLFTFLFRLEWESWNGLSVWDDRWKWWAFARLTSKRIFRGVQPSAQLVDVTQGNYREKGEMVTKSFGSFKFISQKLSRMYELSTVDNYAILLPLMALVVPCTQIPVIHV